MRRGAAAMLRRAPRWGQQVVEVRRTAQAFVGSGVSVSLSLENRISRVPAAAGQSMKFATSAVVCRGAVCIKGVARSSASERPAASRQAHVLAPGKPACVAPGCRGTAPRSSNVHRQLAAVRGLARGVVAVERRKRPATSPGLGTWCGPSRRETRP